MVKDYLNALKNKGNFSWAEISNLSGIPEPTIRKILSGETTDPRFDTVTKLVSAMGGSMNDILEHKKEEDLEMNAIIALKEVYESRISDIKEHLGEHIGALRKDKHVLAIVAGTLMMVLIGLLILDISLGSHGWVRY